MLVGRPGAGGAPGPVPQAAIRSAAVTTTPNFLRWIIPLVPPLVPASRQVGDGQAMLPFPDQPAAPPTSHERLRGGGREILLRDDEVSPRVQRNDIPRVGPDVDHIADLTECADLVGANERSRLAEVDLLGPGREHAPSPHDRPGDGAPPQGRR